jgi:hypothetical protein
MEHGAGGCKPGQIPGLPAKGDMGCSETAILADGSIRATQLMAKNRSL